MPGSHSHTPVIAALSGARHSTSARMSSPRSSGLSVRGPRSIAIASATVILGSVPWSAMSSSSPLFPRSRRDKIMAHTWRTPARCRVPDARMAYDSPSQQERETIALVGLLRSTGDTATLVGLLRDAGGGPERARDALSLLGELDRELLVQVALDALIDGNFADPAAAEQTRRVVRRLH